LTEIGVGREVLTRLAAAEAEDKGVIADLEVMVAAILDLFLSFSLSLSFSAATLDADVTVTGLALATL